MAPIPVLSALELSAFVVFFVVGTALAVVDLRTFLLPDRLLLPGLALVFGLLATAAVIGDFARLDSAISAACLNTILHLGLHLANKNALGFGDVKLAALIGLVTGWVGLQVWVYAAVGAFILSGIAVFVLLLLRIANRNTAIAFGPFMILAAFSVIAIPLST